MSADRRPLTVVSVSTWDSGGGAERIARELHQSYLAAGEDAWLAVGTALAADPRTVQLPNRARRSAWTRAWMSVADALPPRGAGFHLARILRDAVADPLRWAARRRGREDFDFPGTTALLDLNGRLPDVIHLHNLHGGFFDLRELPAISGRVPVIASLHDAWMLSGHCSHSLGCGRWESGCGQCPALWIYPSVPRDATAFNWNRKREIYARSSLHVAVPCEWLADRVRRSMLMPGVRELRVIPFGVDREVFQPADRASARARLGLDPARPLFLAAANSLRERTWKDSGMFRGALERLRGAASGAEWIMLGEDGPDEMVGSVRLRRVGAQHDDRMLARWYQAADAYVHPARADTYPLMVLEALACGTPVIASAVGGVPEQISSASFIEGALDGAGRDRATGALVPAGDAMALAAAIDGFIALDSAARSEMSANAVRAAAEKFDRRRHEREYLEWIHALVAERSGPPREQPR